MRPRGEAIIAKAKARLLVAAALVTKAERELRAAVRELKRHPECKAPKGPRPEARTSLAWWLHGSVVALLGSELSELAEWMREDGRHPERSLREHIEDTSQVQATKKRKGVA